MRWILILKIILEFLDECIKNTKMLRDVNSDGLVFINRRIWQIIKYLTITTENESITFIETNVN